MSVLKVTKKQVLQQSNCNYEESNDREEDVKVFERNGFPLKNDDESLLEVENQFSPLKKPEKNVKSEARKLRNIRLDLSSHKRGVIQKVNGNWKPIRNDESPEKSSEDELKKKTEKKQTPRPVVPNYVTNTDGGPLRKPRQIKQEPLVLSSQTSPKLSPKPLPPLSIERRNARERYRVRQVNEGFTTLRNRIPEYISRAYNEEKKRKHTKKLSKVETLRMAVDYIKHLETLLDLKSTEKDVWIKQIKTESQPWSTPPSSSDYPSPAKSSYLSSPGPSYEQPLDYQDRIYYKYELDFDPSKEPVSSDKKPPTFTIATLIGNDNQSVNDFKIYETLSRLKKEPGDNENDEDMQEENNIENMGISPQEPDSQMSPNTTDVIITVPKKGLKLPPIAETFTKTIPVFY